MSSVYVELIPTITYALNYGNYDIVTEDEKPITFPLGFIYGDKFLRYPGEVKVTNVKETASEIKAKIEEAEVLANLKPELFIHTSMRNYVVPENQVFRELNDHIQSLQSRIDEALKVLGIYRDDADEYLSPEYVEDLDAIIKDLKESEK